MQTEIPNIEPIKRKIDEFKDIEFFTEEIDDYLNLILKNDLELFSKGVFGVSTKKSKKIILQQFKSLNPYSSSEYESESQLNNILSCFFKSYLLCLIKIDINYIYRAIELNNCFGFINDLELDLITQLRSFYNDKRIANLVGTHNVYKGFTLPDTLNMLNSLNSQGYNIKKILPSKPKNFEEIHNVLDKFIRKLNIKNFQLNQNKHIMSLDNLKIDNLTIKVREVSSAINYRASVV